MICQSGHFVMFNTTIIKVLLFTERVLIAMGESRKILLPSGHSDIQPIRPKRDQSSDGHDGQDIEHFVYDNECDS